jgi:hypothetical protein
MFVKNVNKWMVLIASVVSVSVHIVFKYAKFSILTNREGILLKGDFLNPGLTAAYGIIAGARCDGALLRIPDFIKERESVRTGNITSVF